MFKKDRVVSLVRCVRSHTDVNLSGVSDDFLKYFQMSDEVIASGLANSTSNQYYLAFNRFADFCTKNNLPSLPSDPTVIITYFTKLSEEGKNVAPVLMARSAIRHYNLLHRPDIMSPTDRWDVKKCVDGVQKKFSRPVKKREPMTLEIFKKLVDHVLKQDHLKDCNFEVSVSEWQIVAKTTLKLFTFARYEEAIALVKSQFTFTIEGDCIIDFRKGKTNQLQHANETLIAAGNDVYCPVLILKKYFQRINSDYDHYFLPKIVKDIVYLNEPAPYRYSLNSLKQVLQVLGLEKWKDFGEHSDRSGGLSAAANAGVDLFSLQCQARMASDKTPKMYIKRSLRLRRKVSNVLSSL